MSSPNANIKIDKDSILNSEAGTNTEIFVRIDLRPNVSFDLTSMEASSIDVSQQCHQVNDALRAELLRGLF